MGQHDHIESAEFPSYFALLLVNLDGFAARLQISSYGQVLEPTRRVREREEPTSLHAGNDLQNLNPLLDDCRSAARVTFGI